MTDTTERRQGELIIEIAGLAADAVQGEWTILVYAPRVLTMYAEIELLAHRPDGTIERVPGPDALDAIEELRDVMYRPGAGTWFSSRWTVTNNDGQWATEVEFNHDAEPEWSRPVDPGLYGLDLEEFPRRDDLIPDWLTAKLEEARARAK
ncbi:hypothetical protein SAMN05428985_109101 [Nocardioides sp. YR527]|uniref:hypothetical protein n=1 Tax=Nocardioides sp. YR527 TaxID=1881028 RepID=UPI00088DC66A|nr:hypothetical protein [Nocardioides sp. YR527]SDL09124.1 hypothetical protein SAMN05428985_109101 [Nocardioides sp. YR527]